LRAWHFLAEEGADRTKVFRIERGDYLNILYYEFIDKSAGSASAGQTYGNPEVFQWDVSQKLVSRATALEISLALAALTVL
jgi:hypothetical protein